MFFLELCFIILRCCPITKSHIDYRPLVTQPITFYSEHMIFRLLLLFLIVWFLFWMLKKQFSNENDEEPQPKLKDAEDMVACSICGTHVPKSLSIQTNQKFYCCQEHADSEIEDQD